MFWSYQAFLLLRHKAKRARCVVKWNCLQEASECTAGTFINRMSTIFSCFNFLSLHSHPQDFNHVLAKAASVFGSSQNFCSSKWLHSLRNPSRKVQMLLHRHRPGVSRGLAGPWRRPGPSLRPARTPAAEGTPSPPPASAARCGRWRCRCPRSCRPPPAAAAPPASWPWGCPAGRGTGPCSRGPATGWRGRCCSPGPGTAARASLPGWWESPPGRSSPASGRSRSACRTSWSRSALHLRETRENIHYMEELWYFILDQRCIDKTAGGRDAAMTGTRCLYIGFLF